MIWIDFDVQHPVSKHDSKANITPLQALKNKTTKILCLTDYSLLQVLPGDALRVQYSRDEFRSSVMGVEPQISPKGHHYHFDWAESNSWKLPHQKNIVQFSKAHQFHGPILFWARPSKNGTTAQNATENETLMMTRKFHFKWLMKCLLLYGNF